VRWSIGYQPAVAPVYVIDPPALSNSVFRLTSFRNVSTPFVFAAFLGSRFR